MRKKIDLHEEFIKTLQKKNPKSSELINKVADILAIEKDAAYRRLKGKVNFSAREIGIISDKLDISLDRLMQRSEEFVWIPLMLQHPVRMPSIDSLYNVIEIYVDRIANFAGSAIESGIICNLLPPEFFLYSPILTKFMFFKWGHYFVGTEEFNDFSQWKPQKQLNDLCEKLKSISYAYKNYYIWDEILISTLINEIAVFHKMRVITTEEKEKIKCALKELLTKLEFYISGTQSPSLGLTPDTVFYVSTINFGFTSNYFLSKDSHFISFQTNFSFSLIEDSMENFLRLKKWVDSLRSVSTLISQGGRVERSLFFKSQHKIIDTTL